MKNLFTISTLLIIVFLTFFSIPSITITSLLPSNIMAIAKQEKNMVMNKIATSTNTIDNTLPAASISISIRINGIATISWNIYLVYSR